MGGGHHLAFGLAHIWITHIYTDGSKKDEKAGGAATWDFGELQTRIPDGASTFSAEAVALIDALKMVRDSPAAEKIHNLY